MLNTIAFINEMDKLKAVLRQTKPTGLDRYENSAEHSWHTAMAAMVLLQDAPEGVDALQVLKLLLIHDVVEIDAGDVFTYDESARAAVAAAEEKAAVRIFGMLDAPLGPDLLALWREFEAGETPNARFAKALDRVGPCLQNLEQQGASWVKHGISRQRVLAKNAAIAQASPALWDAIKRRIEAADYLKDE
ncbi:MAG: HD domain-containing protein [Pseudomonadota bacterium]